jgi:hypothetical protein
MSHSFKVRPIHFYDGFSFDIRVDITSQYLSPEDEGYYHKSLLLYPYKKKFGTKRSINFNYDQDLKIEVTIENNFTDVEEQRVQKYITYYLNNITSLKENPKYKDLGTPKIHLEFELSSADFLTFEAAEMYLTEEKWVEVEEKLSKADKEKADKKKRDLKAKNATNTTKEEDQGNSSESNPNDNSEQKQENNDQQEN